MIKPVAHQLKRESFTSQKSKPGFSVGLSTRKKS